ncbi:hypothetical protein ACFPM0_16725 [Pseudonocardia sulfidoxydans]|uniref:hypothetical protein n=1 Tax=Pseudonocardia sulfidoxydans TaxID=54011 RepID=UPI00361AB75D
MLDKSAEGTVAIRAVTPRVPSVGDPARRGIRPAAVRHCSERPRRGAAPNGRGAVLLRTAAGGGAVSSGGGPLVSGPSRRPARCRRRSVRSRPHRRGSPAARHGR